MHEINIINIADKYIEVLFGSSRDVILHLRNANVFYDKTLCDSVIPSRIRIHLDNGFQKIKFNYLENNHAPYRALTFILLDETNQKQWAVSIPFDTLKPEFKEMIYGE